jgi:predicted MFS family arabinose efflux permease
VTLSLAAASVAPTLPFLCVASLAIGITSVISTLVLPFAVYLSHPDQRGRTVGTIAASMLIGLLLSRTVSGVVGQAFGWRAVYGVAAGLMVILALVLRALLPRSHPAAEMPYAELIRSMLGHIRTEPVLRAATLNGMLLYAALCAFWATLVFLVESPAYHMGSAQAGLFGLVGAISALAAPFVGRLADRHSPRMLVGAATVVMLGGFAILGLAGTHLAGLLAGIVLLDVGAQSATISNQASVYSLAEEAHSRLYTVYRAGYSLGGSAGAFLGVYGWSVMRWTGVCAVGITLLSIALLLHARHSRQAAVRG